MKIIYLNVHGPNNIELFLCNSGKNINDFDVIFLSETWLVEYKKSSNFFNTIVIPATRISNSGRYQGGLICFYKNSYDVEVISLDNLGFFFFH